jgi:hypothetical protein
MDHCEVSLFEIHCGDERCFCQFVEQSLESCIRFLQFPIVFPQLHRTRSVRNPEALHLATNQRTMKSTQRIDPRPDEELGMPLPAFKAPLEIGICCRSTEAH